MAYTQAEPTATPARPRRPPDARQATSCQACHAAASRCAHAPRGGAARSTHRQRPEPSKQQQQAAQSPPLVSTPTARARQGRGAHRWPNCGPLRPPYSTTAAAPGPWFFFGECHAGQPAISASIQRGCKGACAYRATADRLVVPVTSIELRLATRGGRFGDRLSLRLRHIGDALAGRLCRRYHHTIEPRLRGFGLAEHTTLKGDLREGQVRHTDAVRPSGAAEGSGARGEERPLWERADTLATHVCRAQNRSFQNEAW